MSRVCQVTKKRPTVGNRVSHATLRTVEKKGIDVVIGELRAAGEKI
jgi:ribosomal protein L28